MLYAFLLIHTFSTNTKIIPRKTIFRNVFYTIRSYQFLMYRTEQGPKGFLVFFFPNTNSTKRSKSVSDNRQHNWLTHCLSIVLLVHQLTPLLLLQKKCGKDPAPPFNVACLFPKITAIAAQHGGRMDKLGGQKGSQ